MEIQDTVELPQKHNQDFEMIALRVPSVKGDKKPPHGKAGSLGITVDKIYAKEGSSIQPSEREDQSQNPVNVENYDVYENDDMMDCFMDDIDEMSMCEGSRQSQQDFNYNAKGTMS